MASIVNGYVDNSYIKPQQTLTTALTSLILLGAGRKLSVVKMALNANLMGTFAGMSALVAINSYSSRVNQNSKKPSKGEALRIALFTSLVFAIGVSQVKQIKSKLPAAFRIDKPVDLAKAAVITTVGSYALNKGILAALARATRVPPPFDPETAVPAQFGNRSIVELRAIMDLDKYSVARIEALEESDENAATLADVGLLIAAIKVKKEDATDKAPTNLLIAAANIANARQDPVIDDIDEIA